MTFTPCWRTNRWRSGQTVPVESIVCSSIPTKSRGLPRRTDAKTIINAATGNRHFWNDSKLVSRLVQREEMNAIHEDLASFEEPERADHHGLWAGPSVDHCASADGKVGLALPVLQTFSSEKRALLAFHDRLPFLRGEGRPAIEFGDLGHRSSLHLSFACRRYARRHVDSNRLPAELESDQVGCARSAKRIEDHAAFRTRGQNWNLAEVFRIGGEVQPPVLRVLRHNVPYVAGFRSVRVESQEIEPSLGKFACAAGHTFRIRVRCPLLPPNNHAEVG